MKCDKIVQQFAELLKPIVDTVDRRGLKKHFLKKHLSDVKRFYKWLDDTAVAKRSGREVHTAL